MTICLVAGNWGRFFPSEMELQYIISNLQFGDNVQQKSRSARQEKKRLVYSIGVLNSINRLEKRRRMREDMGVLVLYNHPIVSTF